LIKAIFVFFSLAFIFSCQSKSRPIEELANNLVNDGDGTVILLHGLWRDSSAMRPVERYYRKLGYTVVNVSYPSTKFDIPTLVTDYLAPQIDDVIDNAQSPPHFVTHSMGGILVRYYFQINDDKKPGRVVMLAPPNRGSEIVDSTSGLPFAEPSPATIQLSAKKTSWVNQLDPVDFELGIIAGDGNNNLITDSILPGPDDGVVSVESARLDAMQDFITVPLKHYLMRSNRYVLQQSAYFIQNGQFYRQVEHAGKDHTSE